MESTRRSGFNLSHVYDTRLSIPRLPAGYSCCVYPRYTIISMAMSEYNLKLKFLPSPSSCQFTINNNVVSPSFVVSSRFIYRYCSATIYCDYVICNYY